MGGLYSCVCGIKLVGDGRHVADAPNQHPLQYTRLKTEEGGLCRDSRLTLPERDSTAGRCQGCNNRIPWQCDTAHPLPRDRELDIHIAW